MGKQQAWRYGLSNLTVRDDEGKESGLRRRFEAETGLKKQSDGLCKKMEESAVKTPCLSHILSDKQHVHFNFRNQSNAYVKIRYFR